MMKRFLLAAALLTSFSAFANAQYIKMVERPSTSFQVGVDGTTSYTDYYGKRIAGIGFYGSYDVRYGISVTGDAHFNTIITPNDYSQNSYEAGLRYTYTYKSRFQPYVKLEAGLGTVNFNQTNYGNETGAIVFKDSFTLYTIGGGLDIRLAHHINIRAIDYEYQTYSGFPPNGLNPTELSFGAAYRFR
jgi:opacity protein-like surface antigen